MAIGRAETTKSRVWVWLGVSYLAARLVRHVEAERGRWFLWAPVSFAGGIVAYFALNREPSLGLALVPAILGLALARLVRGDITTHLLSMVLLLMGLGFGAAKLRETLIAAPILSHKLYRAEITGFVERVEPRTSRGPRVTLRVVVIKDLAPDRQPRRVRIRFLGRTPDLRPGDVIRVRATLAPPAAPALPGGYDFARAAYFKGIGGVGYARGPPKQVSAAPAVPLLLRLQTMLQRLRQSIGERIAAILPGQSGAIANALMTGERGQITRTTLDAYRDSGLASHPFYIRFAHGDHGRFGFLRVAHVVCRLPTTGPALPNKEVGGCRRHGCRIGLSACLRRDLRDNPSVHNDCDYDVGRHSRSTGHSIAQCRSRGAGHPDPDSGERTSCWVPNVVCCSRCTGVCL